MEHLCREKTRLRRVMKFKLLSDLRETFYFDEHVQHPVYASYGFIV